MTGACTAVQVSESASEAVDSPKVDFGSGQERLPDLREELVLERWWTAYHWRDGNTG